MKMLLEKFIPHIPVWVSLLVIVVCISGSIFYCLSSKDTHIVKGLKNSSIILLFDMAFTSAKMMPYFNICIVKPIYKPCLDPENLTF